MIDYENAEKIAKNYVSSMQGATEAADLVLVGEETLTEGFGWVFFYNSAKWLETGDIRYAIAGNAPFIVDANDGSVSEMGTAEPIEVYIDEYRENRRST